MGYDFSNLPSPLFPDKIIRGQVFKEGELSGPVRKYGDVPRGSQGGLIKAATEAYPSGTPQGAERRGDRPAALECYRIYE